MLHLYVNFSMLWDECYLFLTEINVFKLEFKPEY